MIIEKIKEYDKIYIIGHVKPDGDCYGSSFGMKHLIKENFGKEATVVLDPCSLNEILGETTKPGTVDYTGSLVISVDTANSDRVADQNFRNASYVIKIDHHIVVDEFGDYNFQVVGKSSACEIIAKWALDNNLVINQDAARALYLGITTDSGRFYFNSTNAETLRVAAALLDTGFDLNELYLKLYEKRFEEIHYLGYVYNNIKVSEGGVLYLYIDRETIEHFGLKDEEVGEAVSHMSGIKDHPVWVLFYETGDAIRVRLRSNKFAVNEVANKYNGGGHKFASGATVHSMAEVNELIKDLEKVLK